MAVDHRASPISIIYSDGQATWEIVSAIHRAGSGDCKDDLFPVLDMSWKLEYSLDLGMD